MEKGLPLSAYIIFFLEHCQVHSAQNKSTSIRTHFPSIPFFPFFIFYIPCITLEKNHGIGKKQENCSVFPNCTNVTEKLDALMDC